MTINDCIKNIKGRIREHVIDALSNEVFQEVRIVEQGHIASDVYEVYEPRIYNRREESEGGLSADENIIYDKNEINKMRLIVRNITPPNPSARDGATIDKDLPKLIEYGDGYYGNFYDYPKEGYAYMNPRPFTANTIADLRQNKQHVGAMDFALRRRGMKVVKN